MTVWDEITLRPGKLDSQFVVQHLYLLDGGQFFVTQVDKKIIVISLKTMQ